MKEVIRLEELILHSEFTNKLGINVYYGLDRTRDEMELVLQSVIKEASEWYETEFNSYVTVPIKLDHRIKANGEFIYNSLQAQRIILSYYMVKHSTREHILKVLKHELIHHYLYYNNISEINDGSKHFEYLVRKYNLPSNYHNHYKSVPMFYETKNRVALRGFPIGFTFPKDVWEVL